MKKTSTRMLFLILIFSVGCGRDLEEAKRYSDMKLEYDTLIYQASEVIDKQKSLIDSLHKISDEFLRVKTQKYKVPEIDRKITKAVDLKSNMEIVTKHLKAIKKFAENSEKATKRILFYKRKYITYATVIQINNENIGIQEVTNGLSAKQYISKYLPKEKK